MQATTRYLIHMMMRRTTDIRGKRSFFSNYWFTVLDKIYRIFCRTFNTALVLLLMTISVTATVFAMIQRVSPLTPQCKYPRVRREWRTFSTSQKINYINAVKCLQHQPSDIDIGGSLLDDFPYTHRAVGHMSKSREFITSLIAKESGKKKILKVDKVTKSHHFSGKAFPYHIPNSPQKSGKVGSCAGRA